MRQRERGSDAAKCNNNTSASWHLKRLEKLSFREVFEEYTAPSSRVSPKRYAATTSIASSETI
jgi:hypothetical protein